MDEENKIKCLYCDSLNTSLEDTEEDADPYNEDGAVGTEHAITYNYVCHDCGCNFFKQIKEIKYSFWDIEEEGVDRLELHCPTEFNLLDSDDPFVFSYKGDEFESKTDMNGNQYDDGELYFNQVNEFKDICKNHNCECSASFTEITVTGSVDELKKLIEEGEISDNYFLHEFYRMFDDYKDSLVDNIGLRKRDDYAAGGSSWRSGNSSYLTIESV